MTGTPSGSGVGAVLPCLDCYIAQLVHDSCETWILYPLGPPTSRVISFRLLLVCQLIRPSVRTAPSENTLSRDTVGGCIEVGPWCLNWAIQYSCFSRVTRWIIWYLWHDVLECSTQSRSGRGYLYGTAGAWASAVRFKVHRYRCLTLRYSCIKCWPCCSTNWPKHRLEPYS
jgi:hypothetical protein